MVLKTYAGKYLIQSKHEQTSTNQIRIRIPPPLQQHQHLGLGWAQLALLWLVGWQVLEGREGEVGVNKCLKIIKNNLTKML